MIIEKVFQNFIRLDTLRQKAFYQAIISQDYQLEPTFKRMMLESMFLGQDL